ETPTQPKLDVSAFQRVLVAGFVAGGSEDLDTNQETVRLLRSQLRNKSSLKGIDADVMPLLDIGQDQNRTASIRPRRRAPQRQPMCPHGPPSATVRAPGPVPRIRCCRCRSASRTRRISSR